MRTARAGPTQPSSRPKPTNASARIDITGERGVEAVCFADTRGSQVEIVQYIGRALRLNKDGSTKVAQIIVPVFLEPNEDPTDMVASASFKPLVAVLLEIISGEGQG